MSIEDVAHELYGLAPEEFTSARNARAKEAKAAGDPQLAKEVQGLRKPTTGAWLLNQLVRRQGEVVDQILGLGRQLRAAQGTASADELRALDRQRRELTQAIAEQAVALGRQAGRRVTDQVTAEVAETLRSAMVDAGAGAALSSGVLTDTFSASGFEPVELSAVVALVGAAKHPETADGRTAPAPPAEPRPDPDRERRLAEARQALAAAESALAEAQHTLDAAHAVTTQAQAHAMEARHARQALDAERAGLQERLRQLEDQAAAAAVAEDAATQAHERAAAEEAATALATDRLREQVAELRGKAG